MIIRINNTDTPTPVSYAVKPRTIKKTYTNSLGDTFIDYIATKHDLTLTMLPLTETELDDLIVSMSDVTFKVEYFFNGKMQTGTFMKEDPTFNMLDFINNGGRWKDLQLVLKEM